MILVSSIASFTLRAMISPTLKLFNEFKNKLFVPAKEFLTSETFVSYELLNVDGIFVKGSLMFEFISIVSESTKTTIAKYTGFFVIATSTKPTIIESVAIMFNTRT
jgi:hypothetical protein